MQILDINNLEELRKYDLFVVDFDGTIVDSMFMWRYICPNFLIYKNIHTEDDILSMITSLTNKEIASRVDAGILTKKFAKHIRPSGVMVYKGSLPPIL